MLYDILILAMYIRVRDRIFYRQAKNTVLLAFGLGLILSLIQIGYDLLRERRQIEGTIAAMTNMIQDSAVQAVYELDDNLARRVVNGLMEYTPIHKATIVDELGIVLASETRPLVTGPFQGSVALLFDTEQHFTVPLVYPQNDRLMGHLHVSVDSYLIAADFFSRSGLILLSEFVRNIALATVFLWIFYMAVTRPLLAMITRLSAVDIEKPDEELLAYAQRHKHDELGLLANSINKLISRLGESLAKYQSTQKELERHRDHLEQLVEQRTKELLELVEELKEAKEGADAASHAKSMFLASMSHEFRTPLNAILGFTQLLVHITHLTPQQHEYLDIIHRSSDHLLTLINQVLDLSKIESGKMGLHEQEFNLSLLLNSLVEVFRLRAKEKNLRLHFRCAPDVPLYVRTDEVKLRQVLINLLSNAIKFTKQGEVNLSVRTLNESNGSLIPQPSNSPTQQLLFEIEDTGVGIGAEAIDQVFEAFTQPSSGVLPQEGTGLGLAISQKFVRLMGGEISVRSTPGQGTVFSFDICVPVIENAGREALTFPGPVITPAPDTPRYRILVVDDIWDNRQLLTILMKQFNFEVQEADTGTRAFELWKSWRPHLIWLDIRMPGSMDGYDVARNIRALEAQETGLGRNEAEPARTYIIAVTAGVLEESRTPVVQAGCDDVLNKPYRSTDVFALVEKYLGVKAKYALYSVLEPENTTLTPELISTLPESLRQDLRNAVDSINLTAMYALIHRIREHSPDIADKLDTLTKSYRFDTLQSLVEDGNPDNA